MTYQKLPTPVKFFCGARKKAGVVAGQEAVLRVFAMAMGEEEISL